ncbi:MAG TPA: FimV/HubP family polar landmark protein [Burkholderiales bacterium]|nr:FimV/HubP family polar landmark protein [Burkholderiales bacterium]
MLAGALLLAPCISQAAGLGKLTILSSLGQPLLAEIDLVSVQKDEVPTLSARIASPDAFAQANIKFSPALSGVRLTIETRANGQPYVRIASTRPVSEPFIDLLVELNWASGRLVREYTALIDPPGFAPTEPVTPVAVPEGKPAAPAAPVAAAPQVAPAPAPAPAPAVAPPAAQKGGGNYGPVQRGETLRKIAQGVKPEGVSLDQMLVGLFRSNRDAFINNNMNLMRTGKILRVPDASELAAVDSREAQKEVRVQVADWNAYRQKLAGAAPEMGTEPKQAASGRISTRVEGKGGAKEPAKEVLKLSKATPAAAGGGDSRSPRALQDRVRSLEEEVVARDKAIQEANDRIKQLEKTIQDMQKLLAIKSPGMADAQKKAEAAGAKPAPTPPKAEMAKAEPTKAEAKPETKPETAPPPDKAAAAPPAKAPEAKAEAPKAEAAKAPEATEEKPKPKPKPKVVAPPPPPPKDLVDEILDEPLYLAGGGGLVALLGLGGFLVYRKKRAKGADDDSAVRVAPVIKPAAAPAPAAAEPAAAVAAAATAAAVSAAAPPIDEVDPLAEADVYIAYGRDAQAEEILKEALAKDPSRLEVKAKLLEIYAARKSKDDFNKLAGEVHDATHGSGDLWLKAAQMGYALDPQNPLYEAGKSGAAVPAAGGPTSTDLDLDFDLEAAPAPTTMTDLPLGADVAEAQAKTAILSPDEMEKIAAEMPARADAEKTHAPVMPDFNLDVPAAAETDISLEPATASQTHTDINLDAIQAPAAGDTNVIDFNFEAPAAPEQPAAHESTMVMTPENAAKAADLGVEIDLGTLEEAPKTETGTPAEATAAVDFNFELPSDGADSTAAATSATQQVDLGSISLDLGDAPKGDGQGEAKDDHWYDVQTKFDLAKAYQEMGDKDGAKEILGEVIKEGDATQQAEAKALLATLS